MKKKEEYAIVLDFLPNGYPFDPRPIHQKTAIAQTLGTENFTILELVPKKGVFLQPFEEVYIGDQKREQIHHINGKIGYERLTQTGRSELEHAIDKIVTRQSKRFVDFFNTAQPLSTRMHTIELLPGIGKKHMWEILERRDEKPFESFEDIKTRVKLLSEPQKIIVKRIVNEIEGKEKHKIFVE
jgi:putative nucleotide binding protein